VQQKILKRVCPPIDGCLGEDESTGKRNLKMKNIYREGKLILQDGEDRYILSEEKRINYISVDKKIIDNLVVIICVLFITLVSYFQG
jgi:hypothetical protein